MEKRSEIHWKRIWRTITGNSKEVDHDKVKAVLAHAKDQLLEGIAQYSAFTDSSFEELKQTINVKPNLLKLVKVVAQTLNLDGMKAWGLFNSYLLFEYFGKIENMQNIVEDEKRVKKFIVLIWRFYVSERSYLLKILAYLLKHYDDASHPFHKEYSQFINGVTLRTVQKGLFKQMEILFQTVLTESEKNIDPKAFMERNEIEQIQVLFMLLITARLQQLELDDLFTILKYFKKHTSTPLLYNRDTLLNLEFAIFIVTLETSWSQQDLWRPRIEDMDKVLKEIFSANKSAVILLVWTTLQTTLPSETARNLYDIQGHNYIEKALENFVFRDLCKMITEPLIQDPAVGLLVKKATMTFFNILCLQFDLENVLVQDGVPVLLSILLAEPQCALALDQQRGVNDLYHYAISLFPHYFFPLTLFMQSLISIAQDVTFIIQELSTLKTYTEEFAGPHYRQPRVRSSILSLDYKPYDTDELVFTAGTRVKLFEAAGKSMVTIYSPVNYFKVLKLLTDLTIEDLKAKRENLLYLDRTTAGYKIILEILKNDPEAVLENNDIKSILDMTLCLLSLSTRSSTFELMRVCLEIMVLAFKRDPPSIMRPLLAVEYLPKLLREELGVKDFENLFLLCSSTFTTCIENEFNDLQKCELLLLYLQLIEHSMEMNLYYTKMQLPGLMYFLVKLFPVIANQFGTRNGKKMKVLARLLSLLKHILLTKPKEIFNFVMELFMTSHRHTQSLIMVIVEGELSLESILTYEVNCDRAEFLDAVSVVKTTLEVVLIMLELIHASEDKKYPEFLHALYWWRPGEGSILRSISGYLNIYVDPQISKLSIKILIAFVQVSRQTLYNSLQVDDYQLQCIFLEKLKDGLEDQDSRMLIIKLIKVCIPTQSSMTLGFFNKSPKGVISDISMNTLIDEVVDHIDTNPNLLGTAMHGAILDLIHELWRNNKQHLLKSLTDDETFWTTLTLPIYRPSYIPMEIILQILEIVVFEMHYCRDDIVERFNTSFRHFFGDPEAFLDLWINRLIDNAYDNAPLSKTVDVPKCVATFNIWKQFMMCVQLYHPKYFETEWNKINIILRFVNGLVMYAKKPEDQRLLAAWGELVVIFTKFPTIDHERSKKELTQNLVDLVHCLSSMYNYLMKYSRTVLLTAINIILSCVKDYVALHADVAVSIITPLDEIFCPEYLNILQTKSQNENDYHNWVLILSIMSTFLHFDGLENYEQVFLHCRFVEKLVTIVNLSIVHSLPLNMTRITTSSLIEYAQSPLIMHLEYLNMLVVCEQFLPPKNCILQISRISNGIIPVHLKNWWRLYLNIIRLFRMLLSKRKGFVARYIMEFIHVHQIVIGDVILSATVVADDTNLELVVEILRFIHAALEFKDYWVARDEGSFIGIMVSVKEILNASIGVILRPKCLIFVPHHVTPANRGIKTIPPNDKLIVITNSYYEIIAWACKCFIECNPPMIEVFDVIKFSLFKIFIEYDFRLPPSAQMEQNTKVLTYGSLLCALNLMCQVLNQIHFPEKYPARASTSALTSPNPPIKFLEMLDNPESYSVLILPNYVKQKPEATKTLDGFTVLEPYVGLHVSWLGRLNAEILMLSLTSLATFLAGQAYLTVNDVTLERNHKRYIKRELCSEMSQFYDFVMSYMASKYSTRSVGEQTSDRITATPRRHTRFRKVRPATPKPETQLVLDVMQVCTDRSSHKKVEISDIEDCYLLSLVHWLRHVCRLVHYSKFDEFLSKWHARSTYVMPHSSFIKNTVIQLSDDEDE